MKLISQAQSFETKSYPPIPAGKYRCEIMEQTVNPFVPIAEQYQIENGPTEQKKIYFGCRIIEPITLDDDDAGEDVVIDMSTIVGREFLMGVPVKARYTTIDFPQASGLVKLMVGLYGKKPMAEVFGTKDNRGKGTYLIPDTDEDSNPLKIHAIAGLQFDVKLESNGDYVNATLSTLETVKKTDYRPTTERVDHGMIASINNKVMEIEKDRGIYKGETVRNEAKNLNDREVENDPFGDF